MEDFFAAQTSKILDKVGFTQVVSMGFTDHPRKRTSFISVKFSEQTIITTITKSALFDFFGEKGLSDNSAADAVSFIMADCHKVICAQTRKQRLLDELIFV